MMLASSLFLRVYVLAICMLFGIGIAFADVVTPSDRATSGVRVRERASATSPAIAIIQPNEQAELTGSVTNWHRVKLPDGRPGYVSKAWTRVQPVAVAAVGSDFTIHAIDVGTGLAIAVKGLDFFLVFDGGSNDDLARGNDNRFLAYLRAVFPDLRVINQMILSHPHRDHVELLPDILAAYEVRNVWDSGALTDICGYRAFITAVSREPGVTYRSARNGSGTFPVPFPEKTCYGQPLEQEDIQLTHGPRISNHPVQLGQDATMTVLPADGSDYGTAYNRNSLVVRLDLGGKRVLLMGDAEAGGRAFPTTIPKPSSIEGKLLACCRAEVKADILVVGHHGSMTSSRTRFLDAVQAGIFVVSSGPVKYGQAILPDAVVVDELSRRGKLLRTDLDDEACRTNASKIGPSADGKVGGCDNIRISIRNGVSDIAADYWRGGN